MTLKLAGTAAAGAALAAGAIALTTAGHAPGPDAAEQTRYTAADRSFSVTLPEGWRVQASGPAATVIARPDRHGLVVVRRRGAVTTDLPRLGRHLEKRLLRELPGARPAGARTYRTAAGGQALLTTLVRGTRVHGVAVLPAGTRSFSLDLLAEGGDRAAARELAAVVRSFRPQR